MTRRTLLSIALLGSLALPLASGCQSMSNTDRGVVTGGVLGATAGALVGGPRNAGAGAIAGGAIGALAGGATGAAIDRSERRAEARAAAQRVPALGLDDVVRLTANGSSDDVIIGQIRNSGSVYRLTANDIILLQNGGVREPVIREMQATAHRPVRQVYTAVPVAQPIYVVEPPPPPIGVGVTFIRRR